MFTFSRFAISKLDQFCWALAPSPLLLNCIAKVLNFLELCKHIFNPKPVMERYGTLWALIPFILRILFGNITVF